ncbi:MAG: cell division protein FtsK [Gammaproteobacteria bacterium]|nr:cell division protein FtsK [Gammaproteobacteria bacterium]MYH86806.1 cell division protein FtsK [Gammaproteobacteria bacterium]MYK06047.1 cell division protein FtsK [Gammaproteobacteria bacterium]
MSGDIDRNVVIPRMLKEGLLVVNFLVGVFLLVALISYSPGDPGFNNTGSGGDIGNAAGFYGAWLADVLFSLLGYLAYVVPAWLIYLCFAAIAGRHAFRGLLLFRIMGLLLILLSAGGLASLHLETSAGLPSGPGGIVGDLLVSWSVPALALLGSSLLFLALLLIGLTLCFSISWAGAVNSLAQWILAGLRRLPALLRRRRDAKAKAGVKAPAPRKAPVQHPKPKKSFPLLGKEKKRITPTMPPAAGATASKRQKDSAAVGSRVAAKSSRGRLPSTSLLDAGLPGQPGAQSGESLEEMSRLLAEKLGDFGIEVEVTAIKPGPVITRFEVQPAAGVKGNRITGLVKDLARSLAVKSVRVVEHIPGRDVIGIEIPNDDREMILLSQVLESKEFGRADSNLSLALGHDILGKPVIVDLGRMPHLLVAGTTGSGKSVGINAMILSLLFKSTPEQVRLILIDPKMLELSVYEGIPHLLTPVVTDVKDAANGLRWCVAEMDRRYALLSALGVRNLAGYNRKVNEALKAGKPLLDPHWKPDPGLGLESDQQAPELEPLPNVVVVVDELADMMMTVGKKVEELIARIAQKARAAGIHLILATQRPSVDVLTGLIKANIPSRLSFNVRTKVDSRTILGEGGAEQLLGYGDMLFLPPGGGVATRVHGAFVSDDEVHRVVAEWKSRGVPEYVDAVTVDRNDRDFLPDSGLDEGGEVDELYDEAVHFVTESRKASISAVQRKLRIGYNRAARMIETMEQQGVVSAMNSNGGRDVLAQPAPRD